MVHGKKGEKMIEKKQLIHQGTGEILREGYRHYTEAMNEEGYRFPSHKAGARIFEGITFPVEMTVDEIGRMTLLSKLMIGATNMLGYRRGRNIMAYSILEIGELARLKNWRGRKFVNRMCKMRVMQRIDTNSGAQYYINPAYFMASGHRLSLDLFLLFRDELKQIVPAWVMNDFLRQAGTKRKPENPMSFESAVDIIANISRREGER